jgi:hypothetical protein
MRSLFFVIGGIGIGLNIGELVYGTGVLKSGEYSPWVVAIGTTLIVVGFIFATMNAGDKRASV